MRRLAFLFVRGAVLFTACLGLPQAYADSQAPMIEVSTDKARYPLGESVVVTVKNSSAATIWIAVGCGAPTLLEQEAAGWKAHDPDPLKDCIWSPRELAAQAIMPVTVNLQNKYEYTYFKLKPGIYKLGFEYSYSESLNSTRIRVFSNAFTVGDGKGEAPDFGPLTIEEAQQSVTKECANMMNHAFLIDHQFVFQARTGACLDASFGYQLSAVGKTGDKLECSLKDSVGGPQGFCSDERLRETFETIMDHLEQDNLGLGSGHRVDHFVSEGVLVPLSHWKTMWPRQRPVKQHQVKP